MTGSGGSSGRSGKAGTSVGSCSISAGSGRALRAAAAAVMSCAACSQCRPMHAPRRCAPRGTAPRRAGALHAAADRRDALEGAGGALLGDVDPVISGISIVASRLKDTPPEDTPKQARGARPPQIVEIDVAAAGQDATFSFFRFASGRVNACYANRDYEVTVEVWELGLNAKAVGPPRIERKSQ